MKRTKTVSLCMIVKNEEQFLRKSINSVLHLVDEIIIVDTGSTDNTIAVANEFNAHIYHFEWENNFAEARNFSLSKATKDWILLLDADDVFEKKDSEKFINLVNTSQKHGHFFTTISYLDDSNYKDYIYNLNVRLLKNNNVYLFKGAIHEQLQTLNKPVNYSCFSSEEIRVHHYGYIPSVIQSQEKRKRNISILEKELKLNPLNAFHNFNMGNEYFALNDLDKAFEFFDKSYRTINFHSGYAPKLVLRRSLCLLEQRKFDEAINSLNESISIYPRFTDLIFYKGYAYQKSKRFTLAIKSYKDCIQLGEAPLEYRFLNGCGTFRAYHALGDLYMQLEDYECALSSYQLSLKLDPLNKSLFYRIGKIYSKMYDDNSYMLYKFSKLFDTNNFSDLVLLSSVLIEENLYQFAIGFLKKAKEIEFNDGICFLLGKSHFFSNNYVESFNYFCKMPKISTNFEESLIFLLLVKIIKNLPIDDGEFSMINSIESSNAIKLIYYVYTNKIDNSDSFCINLETINQNKLLQRTICILDYLLKSKEFEVFEKCIPALNHIKDNNILLELAKLYNKNNHIDMALEEILHSLKDFNALDEDCAFLLYKHL